MTLPGLSCITSRSFHVTVSCNDFADNPTSIRNDFVMEIGDKIYIELCSNRTTGFEWSYEMSGDTVVKEEGHDFQEPESDLVDAPGLDTWTFEAIENGTAVINMGYRQSSNDGEQAERTYRMNIVVE